MHLSDQDKSMILALVNRVAANRDLRYTIMEVGGGVSKVAGSTTVLGLALGPIGLLVGGIVGSVVAYASSGNYKSIVAVLNDMTPEQRSEFAGLCMDAGCELFDIAVSSGAALALVSLDEDKVVQVIQKALKTATECGR